ncbi:nitrogen fixation protein NifM [Pseudaeromonas paramecii]|uniref:peptidylprolyl isomerase n=1 Tax=Pseudaeromonas paramecii TaxID=2138166 RepID=A0ABP8Q6Y5_9GAMM
MSWQAYSRLKLALAEFGEPSWALDETQLASLTPRLERQWALEERVLAYARGQGMDLPEVDLVCALDSVRQQYQDTQAWQQAMQQVGLDEASLRLALTRELLVERVLEQVADEVSPLSPEQALAYYQQHPQRFAQPERRKVRHLLLVLDDAQPGCSKAEVMPKIQALRAQIVACPESFGALAMKHSECPTALHEGLIGVVKPGDLYPELERTLYALPSGEVSGVVHSPMGLHLLQCLEILPASDLSQEEALPRIIEAHLKQARAQRQRQWLKRLAQAEVVSASEAV